MQELFLAWRASLIFLLFFVEPVYMASGLGAKVLFCSVGDRVVKGVRPAWSLSSRRSWEQERQYGFLSVAMLSEVLTVLG